MIIIIAKDFDTHADTVIVALRECGFDDVLRIDLEEIIPRFSMTIRCPSEGVSQATVGRSMVGNGAIEFDWTRSIREARTIWWRRHTYHLADSRWSLPAPEELDKSEASWAVRWLVEAQDTRRFPLGHPHALRAGANKVRQLEVAKHVGFRIPDTIISTDPSALTRFCEQYGRLVIKAVKTMLVLPKEERRAEETRVLGSRAVASPDLISLIARSETTSLFLQEFVDKRYDVRVNILPTKAVACLIHLDKLNPGEIDWRPQTMDLDHEIVELPTEVEKQCRTYLDELGLAWGAFDFGITERGEWIFFECNPNGQWLWIEVKTGYPLSALFAEALHEHHEKATLA